MTGLTGQTRDERLVFALAKGESHTRAADYSGLSIRTVQRRLANPQFVSRVRRARDDMLDEAIGGLADASTDAVQALRSLLHGPSDSVRLGASKSILDLSMKLKEHQDLAERITEIEGRLNGDN